MKHDAQIIYELGLLSWGTAEVGFLRGWIDQGSLQELAVLSLGQVESTDSELSELCTIDRLGNEEIEDLLKILARRFDPDASQETAIKRWCLGHLIAVSRTSNGDDQLYERLEEIDAEFGHLRETEGLSRYYFTPQERAEGIDPSRRYAGATESLKTAIVNLESSLGISAGS